MIWALCGAASAVYWVLSWRDGSSWLRSAIKGLAVFPLAIWALGAGAPVVAIALLLCSIGDVVLSRPSQGAFLAGLTAFALGHLGWIVAFQVQVGLDAGLLGEVSRWILLAALSALVAFMARILHPRAGTLRGPVMIYIGVIMAMGLAALSTPVPLLIAGACLFMASDALLGLQTFVLTKGSAKERAANLLIWPLYWAAVVLMTVALLG